MKEFDVYRAGSCTFLVRHIYNGFNGLYPSTQVLSLKGTVTGALMKMCAKALTMVKLLLSKTG